MKYISNIIKRNATVALLFAAATLSSCDYLDVVPPEQADIKDMIINDQTALQNLYSCYGYLQTGNKDLATKLPFNVLGSDEMVAPQEWQGWGSKVQWGAVTPSSVNDYTDYCWNVWYNAIGYCNQFLSLISDARVDMPVQNKAQYIAEANFLKGYYHYRLLENFGPIPLIDKLQTPNISKNDMPGRSHFDYCVKYIDSLYTAAEYYLPEYYQNSSYYGRITAVACKAMRARLYLLAASPMWNGSFPDRSWKNVRYETPGYGKELVSHEYSREKWVKARQVCLDAIADAETVGFSLFTVNEAEALRIKQKVSLPTIPGSSTDDFKKTVNLFRYLLASSPDDGNNEIIWGMAPNANYIDDCSIVMSALPHFILINNNGVNVGGWGGLSPTLYSVEHFYTKDGLLPEEDPTFKAKNVWYKSAGLSNRDIVNINVGREPRFYASISFDGDQYSPNLNAGDQVICEMRNGNRTGYDAAIWGTRNYCVTGFLSKKWVHPNFMYSGNDWSNNFTSVKTPTSIIRLAELYLILAECDAQLGNTTECLEYLNKIRTRAGVPEMTEAMLAKIDRPLLQVVLDERFIELFAEGTRYYDIRRYLNGKKYQSPSCYRSLNAIQTNPSFEVFNTVININQPFAWNDRMYLLPVANKEVYANPQMVQAPGY